MAMPKGNNVRRMYVHTLKKTFSRGGKIMTNQFNTNPNAGALCTLENQARITLPKAVCEMMNLLEGDQFEVVVQGTKIMLTRNAPTCLACDDDTDVQRLNRTFLCGECRDAVGGRL